MKKRNLQIATRRLTPGVLVLLISAATRAQLPTAQSVAAQMTVGWNLGNMLEAICGETAWGDAITTQKLIGSVKGAGFNTVRIPCEGDCHTCNGVIGPKLHCARKTGG